MMTLSDPVAHQVIRLLLHDGKKQPGAILLTGEWGVGKTYAWNHQILPALSGKSVVYVSLFGLTSVPDLKSALFTNLLVQTAIETPSGPLDANSVNKVSKFIGKAANDIAKKYTGFDVLDSMKEFNVGLDPLYLFPQGTIVCLDDLERTALPPEEVLAVVNFLLEKKGARVLIIANEKMIVRSPHEHRDAYREFKEKVIWTTLEWRTSLSGLFDAILEY
jgi:hypothetical protein